MDCGLCFQFKQVTHQFELGQDWVLPQRVVDNILQQNVILATAVTLSDKGSLSQT